MKFLIGLLVASLAVGGVLCLPAGSPSDDAEVINVPRRHSTVDSDESSAGEPDFKDFRGVIDTGVGYPFLQPHPLPFSFNLGFFDAFEDIFRRLSSQIWPSTDELGAFDTSKGNTTSTVKVVDGHKIEVNETVYGDADNLFKVRLVNIRPLESGEDVAETPDAKAGNPVTSAPNKKNDESESDERREPLEKNSYENEIKHNIDDPEVKYPLAQLIQDTMLPITNEDNAANLNAAFVTDNSLEVAASKGSAEQSSEEEIAEVVEIDGNIEAETNKSVNNSEIKAGMENLENTTTTVEELTTTTAATPTTQDAVEDEALTIENNEETAANNSPNESSNTDDDAAAAEAAATEAVATDDDATNVEVDAAANETTTETADDLRAELDEENINETASGETAGIDEVTELAKSVDDSAEWLGEDAAVAAPSDVGIDEVDNEPNEKRYANYANNKNREDLSSSDDEAEGDEVEMSPGFDSEWGDLKADLARASNEQNDLSNDIDAYDAVPVDLSNDIAVNDIAAQNSDLAVNPDAEVIDVNALKNPGAVPMFEKLSISEPASPAK
ncbi:uncharacterized protein LOC105223799 [Bactrocera dorsalis]|uniref:Uncharacterized protein LOC105223799 n=1 Tax=Bactrocera dorsalis TaxID=27457 RepID=A0ABM3JMA0_BACDO|nr:uncharacterized protein LOC105223799 [Bactrocera dorsalis]